MVSYALLNQNQSVSMLFWCNNVIRHKYCFDSRCRARAEESLDKRWWRACPIVRGRSVEEEETPGGIISNKQAGELS